MKHSFECLIYLRKSLIILRDSQSKSSLNFMIIILGSQMQTSFIFLISFVFSSWIINEFEKVCSGTIQLLDHFADRVLEIK